MADVISVPALFGNRGDLWAGPNQAHVTAQNVDDLRKLVEAELTEAATKPGMAWIVIGLVAVSAILTHRQIDDLLATVWTHCAELVDREGFSTLTNTFLLVENWFA